MGCLHSTHRRPAAYHAQAAPSGRTLTLLTWNTSDGQLSAAAPKHWTWQQQRQGIVDTLVRLQPDVVCLQELQASNPPGRDSIAQMLSPLYTPHGQAFSHRGFCQTFVRQGSGLRVVGPAVTVGPCTLLTLQLADSGDHICVANCHLEPFNTGGEKRARQLQAIVLAAEQMLGEMLGQMLGQMQQQQQGSGDGSGQQQQQQEGGDVSGQQQQQQGSGDVSGQLHAAQPTALVVAIDTNMWVQAGCRYKMQGETVSMAMMAYSCLLSMMLCKRRRAAEDAAVASLGLRDAWVDTGSSQAIK